MSTKVTSTASNPRQPAEATLDAYPDWTIPCKVIAIIPTADRQKSTVKVRVGFDKLDPRILPDMSVKVAFREATNAPSINFNAALVPKSALRNRGWPRRGFHTCKMGTRNGAPSPSATRRATTQS